MNCYLLINNLWLHSSEFYRKKRSSKLFLDTASAQIWLHECTATSLEANCPPANKLSFIDLLHPGSTTLREDLYWGNRAGKGISPALRSRVALTIPDATENPGGLCPLPVPWCLLPASLWNCGLLNGLPGYSGDFSLCSPTFLWAVSTGRA